MLDPDLAALSDPLKDQYFLTNPDKIRFILDAAGIQATDRVVEIGAGVGTVARALPRCASLMLVELDERLIPALRRNAPPYASVLNADGLALIRQGQVDADVILGNVPGEIALDLARLLPTIGFRIAVITAESSNSFDTLGEQLDCSVLTSIRGDDFTPRQPGTSYLVSVRRRQPNN